MCARSFIWCSHVTKLPIVFRTLQGIRCLKIIQGVIKALGAIKALGVIRQLLSIQTLKVKRVITSAMKSHIITDDFHSVGLVLAGSCKISIMPFLLGTFC